MFVFDAEGLRRPPGPVLADDESRRAIPLQRELVPHGRLRAEVTDGAGDAEMEQSLTNDWEVLDSRFQILVVCTGNICRSPLAAAYLQSRFDELSPGRFEISSAGTHGVVDGAVPRQIAHLASDFGLSLDAFRGRVLSAEMLAGADLILTMERRQRSLAVQMEPRSLRRTFTVRELARILPSVPPEIGISAEQRWQSLVALAQRHRQPTVGSHALDDVIDPYGMPAATYREMADQLIPALRGLVEWERRAKRARS